ncbi:pentapeptide repeat-containing protein [Methylobacterium sp. EM32]|uniref:pentapeptide repeat-containing protein n=1 Tax=Methylobacterium sp. EM32 TaxID=3163481 RepID=UPI0033B963BB
MDRVLEIAAKIQTPISLAALAILILLILFKYMLDKLRVSSVIPADTFKILMRMMTYVFIIALVGLFMGVAAFILTSLQINQSKNSFNKYSDQLEDVNITNRTTAISELGRLAHENTSLIMPACERLAAVVHAKYAKTEINGVILPSQDVLQAITTISSLSSYPDCTARNFDNALFSRLVLKNLSFVGFNFTKSVLQEANFSGSKLKNSDFTRADLFGAIFRAADLEGVKFNGARLSEVNFENANLTNASGLSGSNLRTSIMDGAVLANVDLRKSQLPSDHMRRAKLSKTDLRSTDLRNVKGLCLSEFLMSIHDETTMEPEFDDCQG